MFATGVIHTTFVLRHFSHIRLRILSELTGRRREPVLGTLRSWKSWEKGQQQFLCWGRQEELEGAEKEAGGGALLHIQPHCDSAHTLN